MGAIDARGRQIAGLLGYNPGPGIYSRLERAVQAMPPNVRTQELPGLLKRYKEGVPGWELKAVDLDSTIAGRDVVPQDELLAAIRERSPVYTHKEVVLGGNPPVESLPVDRRGNSYRELVGGEGDWPQSWVTPQDSPSPIGRGVHHGEPRFERFGQMGKDYTEVLFIDPTGPASALPPHRHHFSRNYPNPNARLPFHAPEAIRDAATRGTVAHLRFDRHGDALRLNELQSDLANHNLQLRKRGSPPTAFAAQDAIRDIGLKRFLLQGAREGGVIEIASPESIADTVNMPLEHAQHLYGKVYPSELERMSRSLGGMAEEPVVGVAPEPIRQGNWHALDGVNDAVTRAAEDAAMYADGLVGRRQHESLGPAIADLVWAIQTHGTPLQAAQEIHAEMIRSAVRNGWTEDSARILVNGFMPDLMRRAEVMADMWNARRALYASEPELRTQLSGPSAPVFVPPQAGKRWRYSDAMRRRLIESGVGASVLAPLLMQGGEE